MKAKEMIDPSNQCQGKTTQMKLPFGKKICHFHINVILNYACSGLKRPDERLLVTSV